MVHFDTLFFGFCINDYILDNLITVALYNFNLKERKKRLLNTQKVSIFCNITQHITFSKIAKSNFVVRKSMHM